MNIPLPLLFVCAGALKKGRQYLNAQLPYQVEATKKQESILNFTRWYPLLKVYVDLNI